MTTPPMQSFRLNLDPVIHQKAKVKAAMTGKTIADVVRECLRIWVEEELPIILDSAIEHEQEDPS